MINRLRVHYEAESAGTNFKGRMTMAWSVSGRVYSTPAEILAPQTGLLQVIGAWYTTVANFGLNLRGARVAHVVARLHRRLQLELPVATTQLTLRLCTDDTAHQFPIPGRDKQGPGRDGSEGSPVQL